MIIHQPETTLQNSEICISSRIEISKPVTNLPDRLWFRFPESCSAFLVDHSNGFAASLALLAMYLEEPLEVRGVVSPRLAYGLLEWQKVFHLWMPGQFHLTDLKFERFQALQKGEVQEKVGCAFSGGVDSLFTVWSHLPQNQPVRSAQITHGLFIQGFDISLHQGERFLALYERYMQAFTELGLELLPARTNVLDFYRFRVGWEIAHGGPLIGIAQVFGGLFGRFYVPSTYSYLACKPQGTTPVTDHWLSTETLEVVHHGAAKRRIEKYKALGDWPVAHQLLRVCTTTKPSEQTAFNCCRCGKCMRDMIMLEVLGFLPRFVTFREPFGYRSIFRLFIFHPPPYFTDELYREAFAARKVGIAILVFLLNRWIAIRNFLRARFFSLMSKDVLYRLKRRIYDHG